MKTVITFILLSEEVRRRPMWSMWATWSPKGESRGAIEAIVPPKTWESNFIHHYFVQLKKQHSRYKAILSTIVLSQQCWEVTSSLLHLKALMFLYAFEESFDCHLLPSFCDDSNLHISLFKYVLSTMGVSKESISKFLIGNRFHVKITHPQSLFK